MLPHAVYDRCSSADSLVIGDGQFLHAGWIYPHLADIGHYRGPGADYSRSKSRLKCAPAAVPADLEFRAFPTLPPVGIDPGAERQNRQPNLLLFSTSHSLGSAGSCRTQNRN